LKHLLSVIYPSLNRIFLERSTVPAMHESDTYLMIYDEGREKGAREDLLLIGQERFGAPDESVKARLNEITDLDYLRRAAKANSWEEVFEPQ
jgi:hypothetical protein